MKGEQYKEMTTYIKETPSKSNIIKTIHDILPLIIMAFYPIQLLYLLFKDGFFNGITSPEFLKFAIVPFVVLFFTITIRYIFNTKRPYEMFSFTPVAKRTKEGHSFPSLETALSFVIGIGFLYLNTGVGTIMIIMATIVGLIKILSGMHFIKDVLFGGLIGIIFGVIGFFII